MKLQSYLMGEWREGQGEGVPVRDASTGGGPRPGDGGGSPREGGRGLGPGGGRKGPFGPWLPGTGKAA
ncbi:hypothetical protein TthTF19_10890 [Thermus thermophilus]